MDAYKLQGSKWRKLHLYQLYRLEINKIKIIRTKIKKNTNLHELKIKKLQKI